MRPSRRAEPWPAGGDRHAGRAEGQGRAGRDAGRRVRRPGGRRRRRRRQETYRDVRLARRAAGTHWPDARMPDAGAASALAYVRQVFGGLRRRGAEAPPRPDRAGHPRDPAGALAAAVRPGDGPGARPARRAGCRTSISWPPASWPRACCSWRSSTASRRSGSATWASCTATWSARRRARRWCSARRSPPAVRGLTQAAVVYVLAGLLDVAISLQPARLAGMVLIIVLGAGLFSTFSLIIACLVKTRERFMGIGQVLTMPIFFASNAIYPLEIMPAVAARRGAAEPADLRGRRAARADAARRRRACSASAPTSRCWRGCSRCWSSSRRGCTGGWETSRISRISKPQRN